MRPLSARVSEWGLLSPNCSVRTLGPFMALATRRGSDASEDEPGHGWVEELKISQIEQSKLEEELRQIKESTTIRESCKR